MSGPAGREAKDEPVNSGIPPGKTRHPFIPRHPRLDSGLRGVAAGVLGGLFPTPLYHLHPCRRRPLVPDAALPPTSL